MHLLAACSSIAFTTRNQNAALSGAPCGGPALSSGARIAPARHTAKAGRGHRHATIIKKALVETMTLSPC